MKIADFKERVRLVYGTEKTAADGDRELVWEDGEWAWAVIIPKNYSTNAANPAETGMVNRYEVVMRKNYIRHTRHAFKMRIRWKHKLLEMISLWQEKAGYELLTGVAIERKTEAVI